MDNQNIYKIPSAKDREFFRVDGQVYLYCEPVTVDQGIKADTAGVFVPTFAQEEDDFVGLAIDSFREELLLDEPAGKDYLLRVQQLMSMMKRFFDAELQGRHHKLYKRTEINISGSGMSFPSKTNYEKDSLLRASMFFPRYPYKFVSVIGEVIRSDKEGDLFDVKIQFKELSEKSQDEILRFVNQCQRDGRNKL